MADHKNTPREWRLLANRDIDVADYLAENMRPVPTEIIAFHCQQAAEKYLKGALVILGDDPPYIHDLPKLCAMAENHRPSFGSISTLCSIITMFSVQPRYDHGVSLSEADMHTALAHTHTIKEFLHKEIPALFDEE